MNCSDKFQLNDTTYDTNKNLEMYMRQMLECVYNGFQYTCMKRDTIKQELCVLVSFFFFTVAAPPFPPSSSAIFSLFLVSSMNNDRRKKCHPEMVLTHNALHHTQLCMCTSIERQHRFDHIFTEGNRE